MVKFDEITEDQLAWLPDDTRAAIIAGREELKGARWVIGTLNGKLKGKGGDDTPPNSQDTPPDGEDDGDKPLSKNDLAEMKRKEAVDKFIQDNPEYAKDKRVDSFSKAWLSFTQIEAAIKADPIEDNNTDTNLSGIPGGGDEGSPMTAGTISHEDYQAMPESEKQAYFDSCDKELGGLKFSDTWFNEDS